MSDFDWEEGLREARSRGYTVERVLDQRGHRPAKNMACPFCPAPAHGQRKKSAGVFTKGGMMFFKCHHHTVCPTQGKAQTEVMLVQLFTGLSYADARVALLKDAGIPESLWRPARRNADGGTRTAEEPAPPAPTPEPESDGGFEAASADPAEDPETRRPGDAETRRRGDARDLALFTAGGYRRAGPAAAAACARTCAAARPGRACR